MAKPPNPTGRAAFSMSLRLISCGNGVFSASIPDKKNLVTIWRSMLAAFKDDFHAQAC
jgi:hypothetical protein